VKVGAFDVDILLDAEGSFATMAEAFPSIESDEAWVLPINAVLVRAANATVLVDTGLGPQPRTFMADAVTHLPEELATIGVQPEHVDLVLHTHLHVDHVGWDGAFPRARYVIARDDWSFFMAEDSVEARPHLRDKVKPLGEAGVVDLVDGESEVAPGIRVLPTPGHTPGHLSVWIESQGNTLVVLGDVVVHEAQVADPDLVYLSDHDASLAARTRGAVLGRLADGETDVIVGHFHGVGRFQHLREGFSWAARAKEQAAPVE
jgi:glyoxylase-like metal-dependent hydrolase (beta-lactamase superfamily II)